MTAIGGRRAIGEGRVWFRIPEGRTTMTTTISNYTADTLAGQTVRAETPVHDGATPLARSFRGDRRLGIRETVFK